MINNISYVTLQNLMLQVLLFSNLLDVFLFNDKIPRQRNEIFVCLMWASNSESPESSSASMRGKMKVDASF